MSYENTRLLLPLSGTNGGTSFPDYSQDNIALSTSGSPVTSTTQSKFYGSSLYLNESSHLTFPYSTSLNLNTGQSWTVRCWVYYDNTSFKSLAVIVSSRNSAGTAGVQIQLSSGALRCFMTSSGGNYLEFTAGAAISTQTWTHIEVDYNNTTPGLYGFVDGVLVGSDETTSGTYAASTDALHIGNDPSTAGRRWLGYIQDLMIVRGESLHSSGFTPPGSLIGTLSNQGAGGEAVKDDTGSAAARTIIAVPRIYGSTFYTAYQTESDGSGNFEISVLSSAEFSDIDGYSVIALDDSAGTDYNDLVFGRVDAV